MSQEPSFALVLETNNLRGGDDPGAVVATVARLLRHLRAQTRPMDALAEVVVTHDGLSAEAQRDLERAAGRSLAFVAIAPTAGYYEAKNAGFRATHAEVVAFGDGDCWPDARWLEELLAPFTPCQASACHGPSFGDLRPLAFADDAVQVVAGRTTYRDDLLGAAATAIDFMYFPSNLGPGCTRNFYANNVAFRRTTFARFSYQPSQHIYRGHCQKLGFRLYAAGVPVRFVPAARTIHRFPDSARELARLRLLRGADTVAVAPALVASVLPAPLAVVGRLPGVAPLGVLAARLGFSARAINGQDLSPVRGGRRIACLAGMVGLSLLDAAGAVARTAGITDLGVRDGSLARDRLGYHGNGDALVQADAARAA